MSRYGYLDMPDDYSDVSYWQVQATCCECGRQVTVCREDCWLDDHDQLVTNCMCSEGDQAEAALLEEENQRRVDESSYWYQCQYAYACGYYD